MQKGRKKKKKLQLNFKSTTKLHIKNEVKKFLKKSKNMKEKQQQENRNKSIKYAVECLAERKYQWFRLLLFLKSYLEFIKLNFHV